MAYLPAKSFEEGRVLGMCKENFFPDTLFFVWSEKECLSLSLYLSGEEEREKERVIYYEELTHVIMETEKSYDLPSARWRKLERSLGRLAVNST